MPVTSSRRAGEVAVERRAIEVDTTAIAVTPATAADMKHCVSQVDASGSAAITPVLCHAVRATCLTSAMLAATTDPGRLKRRGQIATAVAAVAWSTAGVLQRELTMGAATQVAGRALFALIALLAYVAVVERGAVLSSFRSIGRAGLAVAVCMASASGLFIIALNHASVAHVLFMQAAAPILAALLGSIVLSEPIPLRTWLSMLVAAGGVLVMVGRPSGWSLLGDGVSVVMTLSFAIAIVITRRHRHVSMAPATCLAQLLLVLVFASFAQPGEVGGRDLGLLILLGGVQ